MKIVRLGMTEAGLLFLAYAYEHLHVSPDINRVIFAHIMNLMNWLYTTSGYYDKSVQGTQFNFDHTGLTRNFGRYMEHLKE